MVCGHVANSCMACLLCIPNKTPVLLDFFPHKLHLGCTSVVEHRSHHEPCCHSFFCYFCCSGAALPDYCRGILNAHRVNAMMSYGQTEVGAAVMFTVPGGSLEYMQLLPGVTYDLVSDDGADVAAQDDGRTGELVLHGMCVRACACVCFKCARACVVSCVCVCVCVCVLSLIHI